MIALVSDTRRVTLKGLRAYVTPTIVHFCAVLILAAYLSMPHQSVLSLSLGFGAAAASLLLMFIGIHNAWDIAVWHTVSGKKGG